MVLKDKKKNTNNNGKNFPDKDAPRKRVYFKEVLGVKVDSKIFKVL